MPREEMVWEEIRIGPAFERPFSHDIVVRTPQQVERGLKQNNWFLREIIEKGKVLYDAGNDPVGALRRRGPTRRKRDGRKNSAADGKLSVVVTLAEPAGPDSQPGRPLLSHPT